MFFWPVVHSTGRKVSRGVNCLSSCLFGHGHEIDGLCVFLDDLKSIFGLFVNQGVRLVLLELSLAWLRLSFCSLAIIGSLEHSQATGLAAPIQGQWLSSWLAGRSSLKKEGHIS